MPRDYRVYLDDILTSARKTQEYTSGLTVDGLSADVKTLDAVLYNLQVIGEAAKNVPQDVREKYPDIEWQKMAGLRNILVHEYFGIDVEIIWDVVTNKVPQLCQQVEQILSQD
jgi:uncharacterized protein with HEPN domain